MTKTTGQNRENPQTTVMLPEVGGKSAPQPGHERPPGDYTLKPIGAGKPGWLASRWEVYVDGQCLGDISAVNGRQCLLGRLHPQAALAGQINALEGQST